MDNEPVPARILDCSGSLCPEPVVRTRKALSAMTAGEVLEVLATDPLAELDLAVFCDHAGHELVSAEKQDGTLRFRIRVSPGPKPAAD